MNTPNDPPPADQPEGGPAPAPKSRGRKARNIAIWAVILVAGAAVVLFLNRDSPANAQVGDCVKVNSIEEKDADLEKIDCGEDEAMYEVAVRRDEDISGDCPRGSYNSYVQNVDGDGFTLCLMLNLDKGECVDDFEREGAVVRADCGSAGYRVDDVVGIADSPETSDCAEDAAVLLYPEPSPGRTLCVVRNDPAS